MFKEQGQLSTDFLLPQLEILLGAKFYECQVNYISSGYTGGVYSVELTEKVDLKTSYIIKRISDPNEWAIYDEFLNPYGMNSPKYIGKINVSDDTYIVMEKVSPTRVITHDEWLGSATTWLAQKDAKCLLQLHEIQQIESIQGAISLGQRWWPIIEECARSGRHNEISQLVFEKIEAKKSIVERYVKLLQGGPQTVIHNDFQKRNTLYGADGKFYVIDWSGPCIGSVCVDLARLIAANPSQSKKVLGIYLHHVPIDNLKPMLEMARFRNTLSIFTWMCKAINEGQGKAVEDEYDIGLYIKEIISHDQVC